MSAVKIQDSEKSESKNNTQAILWTAIVLALVALCVGVMPFFYLKDALAGG
jgi:flagellar basal body-associated protein FliL